MTDRDAAELARARTVLGVGPDAGWAEIRSAYRTEIRLAHPDVAGGVTSPRSVELNAAYRLLALSRRADGTVPTAPTQESAPAPSAERRRVPEDAEIVDGTTIVLTSTPSESFRRLVDAAHALGDISYIDRSAAIFEAVLALEEGIHASLVVSLQWRAHNATCEAFCTLEALERAETLDVTGVLEQLLQVLPPDSER